MGSFPLPIAPCLPPIAHQKSIARWMLPTVAEIGRGKLPVLATSPGCPFITPSNTIASLETRHMLRVYSAAPWPTRLPRCVQLFPGPFSAETDHRCGSHSRCALMLHLGVGSRDHEVVKPRDMSFVAYQKPPKHVDQVAGNYNTIWALVKIPPRGRPQCLLGHERRERKGANVQST